MISCLPVLTIMGTIFMLSHSSCEQVPYVFDGQDKMLHIIAYGTLGLSALFAVRHRFQKKPQSTAILVILFCLAYGISDEFHQSFIPGRYPSIFDVLADGIGGILAVTGWSLWYRQKNTLPCDRKPNSI